jgi:hypothetical protein
MTFLESLANPTFHGAHARDETLIRIIDGQLLDDDRAAVVHANACSTCRARIDVLRRRRARLTEILVATDAPLVPVPNVRDVLPIAARRAAARAAISSVTTIRPSIGRRLRRPTRRTIAVAVLILSGAALAAQPVSRWVMARWQRADAPVPVPPATNPGVDPAPSSAAIAFVTQPGEFTIRFDATPASGTLTLRAVAGTKVGADVTAGAKDEGFFVLPDGLRIRNSTTSVATYLVTLPSDVRRVRVQIGAGAASRTVIVRLEPGETRDVSLAR